MPLGGSTSTLRLSRQPEAVWPGWEQVVGPRRSWVAWRMMCVRWPCADSSAWQPNSGRSMHEDDHGTLLDPLELR